MKQVPHSAVKAVAPGASHEERLGRGPLSGMRVLVVDDDRVPRRIIANAVAKAGGEAVEAEDGTAGLALFSAAPAAFDATITDFVMPGLDGADLVHAMRALGFAGPLIGMSGTASAAQIIAWKLAGCDEVLEKGISMAELVNELAAVCRRRARTRFIV
ncbi:MAG: response regulator [Planctomycetota bacterium]|nr:response regulator [Planctomycetaceae bacterium]MDQ3332742.1 response regulator [Planctomycetota bacterium]